MKKTRKTAVNRRVIAIVSAVFVDLVLAKLTFIAWFEWQWDGHYYPEREHQLLLHFLVAIGAMVLPWLICIMVFRSNKVPAAKPTSKLRSKAWPRP